MAALLINPRKRRTTRKSKRKAPAKRRRSTSLATVKTVSTRRYRRNPSSRTNIMGTVKEGAVGAVGAIAAEFLISKLPLPDQFKSSTAQPIVSALASVGVGMLVSKFGKKHALGKTMAQGGVTVAMHQAMRGLVAAPLNLEGGGLAYYDDFNEMGYTEASPTFDVDDDLAYFEEMQERF